MLEHLERGHHVDRAVAERQVGGVGVDHVEAHDTAATHRLEMAAAPRVGLDRGHVQ